MRLARDHLGAATKVCTVQITVASERPLGLEV